MNGYALRCARCSGGFLRENYGGVLTVVIYNNDRELAGVILRGERLDGSRDGIRFIARGNDGGDTGPIFKRLQIDVVFVQLPEIPAREEKINPDGQRDRRDTSECRR